MDSTFKLLSSPLQGFTDFRFRNAFNNYFGGIDTYYAPYIKLNGKLAIKKAYERDILPENNKNTEVIPQIMTNNAKEFLFVANYVKQLGYKELNWNLGCPYPMVTKRGMGAGLICDFVKIEQILQEVHEKSDITVSMKMRMGYENSQEILTTLPILEKFPLKNIAIHARIGKQLYKGGVDLDAFQQCINHTTHELFYNGDITSVTMFNKLKERFPSIKNWMIGRGLIANPFLPTMIKKNTAQYPSSSLQTFEEFHATIYGYYAEALSGQHHLLLKMTSFWEYFSTTFTNPRKTFKKIKKAKSIKAYDLAVRQILTEDPFLTD